MQAQQYIGLDVGQSKTGVARASKMAKLAEPLKTVPTEQVAQLLKQTTADENLAAVVIGLPRGLDGQETKQTDWVRSWVKQLKQEFPDTTFYWQDEALTSKLASEQATKNVSEDALAASIILQDFLNSNEAA